MTAAEAACCLSIPNIIMVQSHSSNRYGRFESPFGQYAIALRPFQRIAWSIVGSGGFTSEAETKEVLGLARDTPNFVGVMLDDFFTGKSEGKRAILTLEELAEIRRQLKEAGRKRSVFVTSYMDFLDLPLTDYLELMDVITLWSGPEDVTKLEAGLGKAEEAAPAHVKMLGVYMAHFGSSSGMLGKSLPISVIERKCETGLRWLRQRRIEGIIFLGNTCADLGFESVEWTRKWIQQVGDAKL
jgi:hypothetical protein